MSTEVAIIESQEERAFNFLQRKAKAFISGSILPAHYRNVGDVIILDEMSKGLNIPMIMLAQGLYIVKGKPSMSGQMVIAIINGSGRFESPMMWEEKTNPWGVRAYTSLDGEKIYGEWITDELIKLNNWATNPHWKNNKGLMARYRSASWFGRLYCPDLLMGFKTEGEVQDVDTIDVAPMQAQDDINQALMQRPTVTVQPKATPRTPVQTAPVEEVATEAVVEDVEEKPKATRMPRWVTKHYERLEACGVKRRDLKAFSESMDFPSQDEGLVDMFFGQPDAGVKNYVNNFYGVDEVEVTTEATEIESPNVPTASQEHTEPQTQETNTQEPKAGVSTARYNGVIISKGIKPEDVAEFFEWAGVNASNMAEFMSDAGAVDGLTEQFISEAGYA